MMLVESGILLKNHVSYFKLKYYITISLRQITKTLNQFFHLSHGTIIRTGITCKKIPVICATQLAGGSLLKMLKYFEVILNIFEFSHVKEIVES